MRWEQRQALERKTSRFIAKHVGGFASKQSMRKSIRQGQSDLLKSKAVARQKLDESIVNDLLTDMRAKSTMICPDLLPKIRKLIASIAEERELWRRMVAFVTEAN